MNKWLEVTVKINGCTPMRCHWCHNDGPEEWACHHPEMNGAIKIVDVPETKFPKWCPLPEG